MLGSAGEKAGLVSVSVSDLLDFMVVVFLFQLQTDLRNPGKAGNSRTFTMCFPLMPGSHSGEHQFYQPEIPHALIQVKVGYLLIQIDHEMWQ